MPTETTERLAQFAVNTRHDDIPDAVRTQAKMAIADSIATVFVGLEEPAVELLHRFALTQFRDGKASALGRGVRLVDAGAAFVNAAAAHALDYDSLSLPIGFVATPVVFPALAVAEADGGIPGREFLAAFVAGYEVEAAIGRGLGVHHWSKGWHSTSTLAHFGAAVGVARLLSLGVPGVRNAMGLAASESSGLRNMMGNMVKVFHLAKAARNGVSAARLAQSGFTAHPSAIEAAWGYCNSFNGSGNYDLDAMVHGLGVQYDLVDPGLVLKVYPCCGLIHSALDGLLDLMAEHGFKPHEVNRIELGVHELVLRTLCFTRPQTTYEARFSAQFCLATALEQGQLRLSDFTEERVRDPALQRLMQRVEMVQHPELRGDETFLQNEFTELRVHLLSSKTLERKINRIDNRGSAGRRISVEDLQEKFVECTHGRVRENDAQRAFEMLMELESVADMREITSLLH